MTMVHKLKEIYAAISRVKPIDNSFESPLRRCLVFWDLLLLGIGGSVDVALYVVLGNVIRDICGPAIIISMVIGFLVCFGSGLCYAEFASYIPTSGSDYDYVYASLGELCGFFDGWCILAASVIATATLSQGAADLLNSLTDSVTFENVDGHVKLPDHALLAPNLNIVATLILILVTVITAVGVHGSIRFNDCIVIVNLLVVVFTVILGFVYVDFDNWSTWNRFAPYGFTGILQSLPYTVFFYGGFVSVTFSTEEVINPSAILPRSILASLIGIFVLFMAVGIVLTLIIPYNQLPMASPLSDAFGIISFKASKYIIAAGGFCSCFSSVLTASYANSRLSYVMSRDGLLLKFLKKVNKRSLVPLNAVLTTGFIAALLTAFVNLTILVEVCSLLALVPCLLLYFGVIRLRYKRNVPEVNVYNLQEQTTNLMQSEGNPSGELPNSVSTVQRGYFHGVKLNINIALAVLVASAAGLSITIRCAVSFNLHYIAFGILMVVFLIPLMVSSLVIYRIPKQKLKFPFTMPFVPVVPTLCLTLTVFLMFQFSIWAWIMFLGNIICGLIIYFGYGIKHSQVQKKSTTQGQEPENAEVLSYSEKITLEQNLTT